MVTSSQLHVPLKGMRDLPPTNQRKVEVPKLIRTMQNEQANPMEPSQRIKQLDKIMGSIERNLHASNEAHQKLLDEQEQISRRLEKSNDKVQQMLEKHQDARSKDNRTQSPHSTRTNRWSVTFCGHTTHSRISYAYKTNVSHQTECSRSRNMHSVRAC